MYNYNDIQTKGVLLHSFWTSAFSTVRSVQPRSTPLRSDAGDGSDPGARSSFTSVSSWAVTEE